MPCSSELVCEAAIYYFTSAEAAQQNENFLCCAGNSDLIHQMYIYGSSLRSYLLAAVVPSKGMSSRLHLLHHWLVYMMYFGSLFEKQLRTGCCRNGQP